MQSLLSVDQQLFLFLNHLPHVLVIDMVMQLITLVSTGGVIWVGVAIVSSFSVKKNFRRLLRLLCATLVGSALLSELIKRMVTRPRPGFLDEAIIVGHQSSGFSFPSSHATAAFAGCVVLSAFFPKRKGWFFLLAFAIAFSRVYLGQHYPLDVIAGGLLGWGVGRVATKLV